MVLFRDSLTGTYVVFDDVCSHRAAALSDGRLIQTEAGTQIQCGYHGWTFNSAGTCTEIAYANTIPEAACLKRRYPTTTWKGLVFVWNGDKEPDESLLPIPEEVLAQQDNLMTYRNYQRRLKVSFIANLENLVDPAHVNWAHHGTGQGLRTRIPRNSGVDSEWTQDGHLEGWLKRTDGAPGYRGAFTFQPPGSVCYHRNIGLVLTIWHLPTTHDECIAFSLHGFINATKKMKLVRKILPRWREHAVANLIFDGDILVIQKQEAELQRRRRDGYGSEWKGAYLMANGKWDSGVAEFRKFVDANAVGMPWEMEMKARVDRVPSEEMNDRYLLHTKSCTSCSQALRWANRGMWSAAVGMILGAILVVSAGLVRMAGVPVRSVFTAGVSGVLLCVFSGLIAVACARLRRSLMFSTKAYDLTH